MKIVLFLERYEMEWTENSDTENCTSLSVIYDLIRARKTKLFFLYLNDNFLSDNSYFIFAFSLFLVFREMNFVLYRLAAVDDRHRFLVTFWANLNFYFGFLFLFYFNHSLLALLILSVTSSQNFVWPYLNFLGLKFLESDS
jgi:hypothetical protein